MEETEERPTHGAIHKHSQLQILARYARRLRSHSGNELTFRILRNLNGAILVFAALAATAVVVLVVALVLRVSSPHSQLTVSAFQLMDTGKDVNGSGGKALADMVVDDLHQILEQANRFSGNNYSSSKTLHAIPNLPEIPVETTYGIEIRGISLDQVLATWSRVRYEEYTIDGDFLKQADGPSILIVRYKTSGRALSFQRELNDPSPVALRNALAELSLELVKDFNPQAAARFLSSKAMACSGHCESEWQASIDFCKSWAQRQPNDALALYFLGYSLDLSGHPANAVPYYQRSLELNPKAGFVWNNLGAAFWDSGRIAEAKQAYLNGVQHGRTPNALMNLGVLELDIGHYEIADDYMHRALKEDPNFLGALLNLGHVQLKERKYPEALQTFKRVQNLRPGDMQSLFGLTHSLAKVGKVDEALQQCDMVAQMYPSSESPLEDRARVLMTVGRYGEAETALYEAKAIANTLSVNEDFVLVNMFQGDFDKALELVNELISQFSSNANLHLIKADVLDQLGKHEEAEAQKAAAESLQRGSRFDIYRWDD